MELFRAYSDSSQGCNSKTLFASGAAASFGDLAKYTPPSLDSIAVAEELTNALAWNDKAPSKFIFFTGSLLFATQLARYRKQKGEDNVRITCFDPKTATTPDGQSVRFWSVSELIEQHGIVLKNKDGSYRDYADVYIAMDCVVPSRDPLTAELDEVEQAGLYSLYPAMASGYRSHRARLALTTLDMREFHFQEERSLTFGHVNVAAKVAATFSNDRSPEIVPSSILTHVLALRKRRTEDSILISWLESYSTEIVAIDDDCGTLNDASKPSGIPEIDQCRELKSVIGDRHIDVSALDGSAGISEVTQQQESQEWEAWRRRNIDEKREAREQRPDYVPRANDRKRRHHGQDDANGSEHKRVRRDGTEWLPRAEYEAQRGAMRIPKNGEKRYDFTSERGGKIGSAVPGFKSDLSGSNKLRHQNDGKSRGKSRKVGRR